MCVLRTHIKLSVFRNIFSRIEKVMTTFSIPEKMFPKTENGHTLTGPYTKSCPRRNPKFYLLKF